METDHFRIPQVEPRVRRQLAHCTSMSMPRAGVSVSWVRLVTRPASKGELSITASA